MSNTPTQDEAKAITIILIAIFTIIIVSILFSKALKGAKTLAEKLGLAADKATKDAAAKGDEAIIKDAQEGTQSPWNPQYYKGVNKDYLKPVSINNYCKDVAKMFYDSVSIYGDDPSKAIAAVKKINSKAGLSAVAAKFDEAYHTDLFEYLHSHFDTPAQIKAFATIIDYVGKLPNNA